MDLYRGSRRSRGEWVVVVFEGRFVLEQGCACVPELISGLVPGQGWICIDFGVDLYQDSRQSRGEFAGRRRPTRG
eukprot:502238-Rhodomonas_salina.1